MFPAIRRSTATAKMLAIRWSWQLAKELHMEKILVQSDALTVVNCINHLGTLAILEFIATNIRSLIDSFKVRFMMFLSRRSNTDAHNLVSLGKLLCDRSWMVAPPPVSSVSSLQGLFF